MAEDPRPRVDPNQFVDDDPGAALQHSRQHGSAAPERGEQRATDLRLDLRLRVLRIGLRPDRAANIVNQDVDTAEAIQSPSIPAVAPEKVSRSTMIAIASAPAASASWRTSSTSGERSTSASLPPSCAMRSATVRPMPCAAPVTTATLPAKRPGKITAILPPSRPVPAQIGIASSVWTRDVS
jgi:hypothetical protein